MTYDILIGDKSYSSWSLRAWLLFDRFDIPVREHCTELYDPGFAQDLRAWAPARTVPVVRTPEGALWSDSLTIAEGLAQAHPSLGLWPTDPKARGLARSMVAEMHSGFTALRSACPMNLRVKWQGFQPSEAVLADLERIQTLWAAAMDQGPWLFGDYGIADAFYAPVAARIAGYGLPVSPAARAYVNRHLADPSFLKWRALGEARNRTLAEYKQDLPTEPWPAFI